MGRNLMAQLSLPTQLGHLGLAGRTGKRYSAREAADYCRQLARSHYENFTVASWLLPRRLLPHFYSIYAYCRWADDLADETGDPQRSLELLDAWQDELERCYAGEAEHPVFVALGPTIRQFDIPREPFLRLLNAFRQDQEKTRYATHDEVLTYCRDSANPVGRLVLYLGECHDEECGELSDSICTGLQLINFCQDIARDWAKGRIYLPADVLARAGCSEATFARGVADEPFRAALEQEVQRAEDYLHRGQPLIERMPRELRVDIALFAAGGLAIAQAIRAIDFDVWRMRPTLSKPHQLRLLAGCWWRWR
jgi:squalene synthase HpnC